MTDTHDIRTHLLNEILALKILQLEDITQKKKPATTQIRNDFRKTLRAILDEMKEKADGIS